MKIQNWRSVAAFGVTVVVGVATIQITHAGTVQGQITDETGKALRVAHAMVFGIGAQAPTALVQADKAGMFSIQVTDGHPVVVRLVGINTVAVDLPVQTRAGETVNITVRLMSEMYFGDTHPVMISLPYAKESVKVLQQQDLSWRGTVEGVEAGGGFQIRCAFQGLEYPLANSFELDKRTYDGYISKLNKLPAQIEVSRDSFLRRTKPMKVMAKDSESVSARLIAIATEYQNYHRMYMDGMASMSGLSVERVREGNGSGYLRPAWYVNVEGQDELFKKILETETQPLVRELAARTLIHFSLLQAPARSPVLQRTDAANIEKWLEDIPFDSPFWTSFPGSSAYNEDKALAQVLARHHESDIVREYAFRFMREAPVSDETRRYVGVRALRFLDGTDEDRFNDLYQRIQTELRDERVAQQVEEFFAPKFKREHRQLEVGKLAPAFAVKNFRDPGKIISNASFQGKTYLVDFWSTTCGPCIREFPELHKWYAKYSNKGFEIVSFSNDLDEKAIRDFHKKKFPMPWANAQVGYRDKVAIDFGVMGTPRYLLVDAKGKIIHAGSSGRSNITELGKKLREIYGF